MTDYDRLPHTCLLGIECLERCPEASDDGTEQCNMTRGHRGLHSAPPDGPPADGRCVHGHGCRHCLAGLPCCTVSCY